VPVSKHPESRGSRCGQHLAALLGICILLSLPAPGWAQDDDAIPLPGAEAPLPDEQPRGFSTSSLEFRGYVENTLTAEHLREDGSNQVLNAIRTRVNVCGEPYVGYDFGIGVVAPVYSGTTRACLVSYLPKATRNAIVQPDTASGLPGAADLFVCELESEIYVQEAFGTVYTDHVRLRLGRHKFYTGTGYAYNPIDLLNPQDPRDPTYEIDGIDAALVTLLLPRQTEVQGLVVHADRPSEADYLARLRTHISGWDVALQFTRAHRERVDWEALNTREGIVDFTASGSTDPFIREFRWNLIAGEFAGEVWGVGLHGEGGYVFAEETGDPGTLGSAARDHERILLGIDHTFDSQLYVIAEYLRCGQGRTASSDITLNDRMALVTGEILSANRDNLFAGWSYPLTDLSEVSLYSITALNDPSAILNPWLLISLYPGLKLSLTAYIPVGDEESQNGRAGASGFARLKFHF
jgi:hypothetical protein